ncbi:hypothetical protein Q8G35_18915 [Peribacillus simplex]|uniref:DUF2147 domain-containing protein n=2 Tax=Peribacillus TaxID=2675229 RepID=A0AA90P762_9BACI|nr:MULTISPECIES: hypothetical protein [Peribacillus]MDP1420396.1 hypothetical protein [Peribacillus simplex]MDP1454809.1 hypothetical protein [Peribacillus frigoritolerans]
MKKFMMSLVVITTLVCVTLWGTETSNAASWTLVDKKTSSGKITYLDGVKGGYAKICLKEEIGGARFDLYDNDGENSPMIKAGVFIGNNDCYKFYAAKYVDGSDNDAEFALIKTRSSLTSYVLELWD